MAKKTEEKKEKLEREYIIPLRRRYQHVARYKKTPKAVRTIKEFLVRHMKIRDRDLRKIKIGEYLNEFLWARGIKNPPSKIKVKAIKEGEIVKAELVEFPDKLKFKKICEEKVAKKAEEEKQKKKKLMEKAKESMTKQQTPEKTEEEKKEEKEKIKAGEEASNQLEKAQAKAMKHQTGGNMKQPKRQQRKALAK